VSRGATAWLIRCGVTFGLPPALSTLFRLVIDLGDLLRAEPEARYASWQLAREVGVFSPNDTRLEEGLACIG
jgi:hypothetical protein